MKIRSRIRRAVLGTENFSSNGSRWALDVVRLDSREPRQCRGLEQVRRREIPQQAASRQVVGGGRHGRRQPPGGSLPVVGSHAFRWLAAAMTAAANHLEARCLLV